MMRLQVLVASMEQNVTTLAEQMNLRTEAILCNQGGCVAYEEYQHRGRRVRAWTFQERGVGRNRNNALLRADGDLCLFSDEDIVYEDDYEEKILRAFEENPEADLLLFNVEAAEGRKTYENLRRKRVRWYNYGRYPTYSVCARRSALHRANVWFSLLFGGGAKYSNGEDSLFLHDCLRKGLTLYAVPVTIGYERERQGGASTWFTGYNEKFFYDRGVLYHFLYGRMAGIFALRFLLAHREQMCREIPLREAYGIMRRGIREA
ncbi:MAG: glycosyltransferase [Eubacteriales bacterium]|nr:glycosyltransferase [Eubacteriales bacterium]